MSLAKEFNETLKEYIRPATHPVWVKISKDKELPEGLKTPRSLFGHPLAICQCIAIARRYGWTMGFTKEDIACGLAIVEFGLVEFPEDLMDGRVIHPLYAASVEAGGKIESAVPKMPFGEINSVIVGPLSKAENDFDAVLVYANPGQVVRLIHGALYKEGGHIDSRFAGRAACCSQIITPYQTQKCNVIIPGGGEKVFAMTCDDEMAFAIPAARIQDVMEGIIATHKAGAARIPNPYFGLRAEPVFPEKYKIVDEYCGLR